ncbi:MAG TPA: DUF2383 domain-containing protein [Planctomycetota bacterium]|nr:DUF2383 domain-containing protein [Planctomycetota bacterium]
MSSTPAPSIDRLNSFLRAELSAVETYDEAIPRVDQPRLLTGLRAARESHVRRVATLQQAIRDVGGIPSRVSGVWGGVARLLEGPPRALTPAALLDALLRGEQYARNDYERLPSDESPWLRGFVEVHLAPAQRESFGEVQRLVAFWRERQEATPARQDPGVAAS